MKTFVILFLIFFAFLGGFPTVWSQQLEDAQVELIQNDWYLIKTEIAEEDHFFIANEEFPQVSLQFNLDDGIYYFSPSFCDAEQWSLAFFSENEFMTTFESSLAYTWCNDPDNIYYDSFYYWGGFWTEQEDQPFEFYITSEENLKSLVIVGHKNDKAFYQNVPYLSVNPVEKIELRIYPNPVKNVFQIENLTEKSDLKIFDLSGKVVFQQEIHPSAENVDISFLNSGLYLYGIFKEDKRIKTGKLIKKTL